MKDWHYIAGAYGATFFILMGMAIFAYKKSRNSGL